MKTETLQEFTAEELEAALAQKKEAERIGREQKREAYEALKKDTIADLAPVANDLSLQLMRFRDKAFSQLGTLYELLQDYSKRHQDGKGNFTIEDDEFKIQFKRQGKGTFDERSEQAEKHIIDFLNTKYQGDLDTKDLIMSLLERKKGDLDINMVQKLYSMEDRFDDENWREGIKLLKESYSFKHSKDYVSFFKKGRNNQWEGINLNFSYS
ncbi:DUF3164 family protein [Epilithonimonas vandammei]|uniref:DUF3164 family protein n=1 Tax=Epilithonimonas vandammei TaxID=2487072 RepID=A0A3G8ZB03_9FLAO|nr:DUF3164 family protein [Epilithonimonas vandammei]AZI53875.1 DUF3164 family protein [Epilithonimonas vandammei]AZI55707.1 DUF3164 family protein [Epilithonimonas vandammei]